MKRLMEKQKPQERSGFWSGAIFGMLTGMASLVAYQYLTGILREPSLISKKILSEDEDFETKEMLALFIAAENLRSGIQARFLTRGVTKKILHAGYRNFRECWARDFGFAAYGLIAAEQFEAVRDTLESFFWHQKKDGQLPVKLYSMNFATRFLHSLLGREQPTERLLRAKFISAHGAPSLDGQVLIVIAALHYVWEAEDYEFLRKYWEQLTLGLEWLRKYRKESAGILLHQGAYADWADSVARRGAVLYTNVIYWKVLTEMAHTAADLDLKKEAMQYYAEAEGVSRTVVERFWRPDLGYFVTSDTLDNLSSDGNLLAIAWELATTEQSMSILKVMKEAGMSEPVPTRVVYPSYPMELISFENHLGGLANYHTDASWLWLGAWHLIALTKIGDMDQAGKVMERIMDVVVNDQEVNEVHGPDGKPLASFWYKSEAPLTWNAGMILYASRIYNEKLHADVNPLSMLEGIMD
jgi:glycogen debranching enzyme